MTVAKIEVFENSTSLNVIRRFSTIESLVYANKTFNWSADQISVNDCVLMGWDELYDFI